MDCVNQLLLRETNRSVIHWFVTIASKKGLFDFLVQLLDYQIPILSWEVCLQFVIFNQLDLLKQGIAKYGAKIIHGLSFIAAVKTGNANILEYLFSIGLARSETCSRYIRIACLSEIDDILSMEILVTYGFISYSDIDWYVVKEAIDNGRLDLLAVMRKDNDVEEYLKRKLKNSV